MTENKVDQPTSVSQLLRESYLAEARAHQRHSEMSRSDSSSSRHLVYGPLKGKAEDSVGHEDPQLPDLSAFLSQEELDKSVNLARQAIGHESYQEKAEVKSLTASATNSSTCTATSSATSPLTAPPSTPLAAHSTPFAAPSSIPFTIPSVLPTTQLAPERKEHPLTHSTLSAERQTQQPPMQDSMMRNNKAPKEGFQDFNVSARNTPYGPETQSKKEFLNKAADFIEELSSLFKANSSKRIRPRTCKAHRSRHQNKSHSEGAVFALNTEDRERPILPQEMERPAPAFGCQPENQMDPAEFDHASPGELSMQDCRTTEDQYESGGTEVEETESPVLAENTYRAEPVCEPPCFIQKLKSREVAEGIKVQLDCIVRGLPMPEVRWFCEGKELENSPDIQIINNGELHSLIIAEAFEEDTGRYSCFASNFYGTDSTSAEIYIEGASSTDSEGEQRFEHTAQLKSKTAQLAPFVPVVANTGVSVDVEDHASENPEEYQQEVPSKPSGLMTTSSLPLQTTTTVIPVLEVPPAIPDQESFALADTPEVTAPVQEVPTLSSVDTESTLAQDKPRPLAALATSILLPVLTATTLPLTQVVSSALPIQVAPTQTTPPESQNSNEIHLQELNVRPIMAAPVFTKSLQDLLSLEGQLVVLECRVKGVPSPKVSWYRDGIALEDSPDFRILQKKPRSMAESEEICTLVISEVFPEDSGTFTCTASNKYGTVSSIASLRVKGNGNNSNHVQASQLAEPSLSELPKPQSESSMSIKPHSSTIRLDPLSSSSLRLDPLSTSTLRLDPHRSSVLRQDPLSTSLPSLDPLNLSTLHQDLPGSTMVRPDAQKTHEGASFYKPFTSPLMTESQSSSFKNGQEDSRPKAAIVGSSKGEGTVNHQNVNPTVVPLPDPPTSSCLKSGVLVNHKEPRSGSRVGLRVHFKLPEDEEDEDSDASNSLSNEDMDQASANKEPPPVLAKPKLDPVQLQLLHNQVLMEQQQEGEPSNQKEASNWPAKAHHHPHPQSKSQVQPLPQAEPQSQIQVKLTTQPQPQPHVQPQPLVQHQPQPQFQPQPQPQFQPQPQPQPQFQAQFQPQFQPQSQPQPQPTTQLQPQPQFRPQSPFQPKSQSEPSLHPPPIPTFMQTSNAPLFTTAPTSSLTSIPVTRLHTTAAPLVSTMPAPLQSITFAPHLNSAPAPPKSTLPSPPLLKTAPLVTSPPPAPQLTTTPAHYMNTTHTHPLSVAAVTQMTTIHASHLNLAPSSLPRTLPTTPQFSSPSTPHLSTAPAASLSSIPASLNKVPTSLQDTSPYPMLRSTHASLMNLAPTSQSFNYARPKEFIAAQSLSPVRSPPPTESPVPLLHELAAELLSSTAKSPTSTPFSPPPRVFPIRVLKSPTSPTSPLSFMSSPTLVPAAFLNSVFALRSQSPPQASSPTSSSSTPSPIQNPVAFLSSVLPSLHTSQPTNSMGLPRSAPAGPPQGILKKVPRTRLLSNDEIRDSRESLFQDIEKKLQFKDEATRFVQQEYKVSNFEHRLMSEIEFRLERTPVEESDDEVQHDEIPTGKCIAPIFDKKLKNFRAMEGVPVTFSCKVVGIPIPKVYWFKDGKQILSKNDHFKKIREGDGTCALHIETTINDDDGNYTVMAANPQGRISCSGHLIVQTGPVRNRLTPMIHSQRVRARVQEVEEGEQTQERFFRPHFLQAPGDMLAHEGKLCRLDCKVSGLPNPELMWLINGRPIYPDFYHRMLVRENGVHSLVMDPLTQNDAGTYTCIASNKAGQSSFCLELKVVEKEMKQPPQFVEKLQNTGIPEGTPVRLECRVVGLPPPVIFWKKDNDSIPSTKDRVNMHQDATGYVCLLIQPTRKEDAGWYTVSAKNEAGIVSCTARLDIYAQWHQQVPVLMKKSQRPGSRYAVLTGQGLDIRSAFPTTDNSPILFSSSPVEATLESEEL
ncbi:myopalladin isoform X2 [Osmerus eperlanus]|uniref:myopalladin isoform X2 n=1 Tax=Osmerus eperlanus TaxID=29151 RepID=UPI002E0FEB7A